MTWSQEISQLITDVDQLTSAANVKKSTLDASVASTEADKNAAAASIVSATASFASAGANATQAEAHKNAALAIYGTNAAQQTAVASAQASAALASGYAASGSAALQQDLSGIATTLHRSPNAITSTFIYDTSKDSDGGAWTEKCQNTSWYNEPIMGKWLGPQDSELIARAVGGTLGSELVTNGNFSNGSTGWATETGWSVVNNVMVHSGTIGNNSIGQTSFVTTVGKIYRLTFDLISGSVSFRPTHSSTTGQVILTGTGTKTVTYGGTGTGIQILTNNMTNVAVDNISVREVTPINTTSGDYYQLTTDGKFYRLWKNLFSWSEQFNNAVWSIAGGTLTGSQTDPLGGSTAFLYTVGSATQSYSVGRSGTGLTNITAPNHNQSFYVKSNGANYVQIAYGSGSNPNQSFCNFDLTDGSVGTAASCTGSITPAGNGYYRISVSVELDVGAGNYAGALAIIPSKTSTRLQTVVGNNSSGVLIWGAQLETGSAATTYEPKTTFGSTSEVFRGNKRDFPRLAGIVCEAASVSIYDLTEPGRPMWMRFTGAANMIISNVSISTVSALVAKLVVGGSAAMQIIDFMADSAISIQTQATFKSRQNIAQRNQALGVDTVPFGAVIPNNTVNAVAMTILPDAPIDPITGLRVPTIALGTNSGASIIKHNGTVVNSVSSYFESITLSPNVLTASRGFSNADHFIAFNPGSLAAGFTFASSYGDQFDNIGSTSRMTSRSRSQFFKSNSNRIGLRWLNESMGVVGRHLSGIIAPTYNTGWMHGDVRRAYLSDTGAGSLTAPELVTNGTFDSNNAAGWTLAANVSIVNERLTANLAAINTLTTGTTASGTSGKTYRIEFDSISMSGAVRVYIAGTSYEVFSVTGKQVRIITAIADFNTIVFQPRNGSASFEIDNISVREVVVDRTYRAQGAGINGTLIKAQLASGTSLVGYSGFSAANYLRESYSADLDFGTGEFNTSAWLNIPATLPLNTYPVIGSAVTATGWTNSGWDTFSTTGGSFTASKTIAGGLDTAISTNTVPVILGNWYRVIITVSAVTFDAYSVNFSSGANSRSTQGGASGTGTKVFYIQANVATGNFTVAVNASSIGSITVDSVSIQEIGQTLVFDRNHTSGPRIRMGINGGGNITAEAFDGTTTRTVTTTAAYNVAQWLKAETNYTTDGSLAIQVNGREVAVTRGNPLLTLTNTSATLTVGNSLALDAPFPGSITLLKLGTTVPTTEQSTFMYEQEKQLFRANAVSVLPDTGSIVGMSYDDTTDRWSTVSAANESYWNGLVRTSVSPVPAGSYSRITTTSGIELASRITTNPGVDVTIPAYVLREELVKRSETANKLNRQTAIYDYIGGFTGNITTGSTAIASVTNLTYPVSLVGARISGTGIPANTTITAVSGTTIYISAAATATTTGLVISFLDFELPVGFETESVTTAGVVKQEGATKDYTRLFDGFIEMIRFAVAPGATTWVRIQASKSIQ